MWTAANDHDNIHVGKHDGRFRAIQLRVEGGEVFFEKVIVHFHDGSHEELVIRDRIPSGGQTRAIDLPGDRRVIESVELWYGKPVGSTARKLRCSASGKSQQQKLRAQQVFGKLRSTLRPIFFSI